MFSILFANGTGFVFLLLYCRPMLWCLLCTGSRRQRSTSCKMNNAENQNLMCRTWSLSSCECRPNTLAEHFATVTAHHSVHSFLMSQKLPEGGACYIMDDWIGTEKLQGDLPLAGDHVVRPDASGGDGAAAWSTQGCTDEAATAAAACGRGRWPQRSI